MKNKLFNIILLNLLYSMMTVSINAKPLIEFGFEEIKKNKECDKVKIAKELFQNTKWRTIKEKNHHALFYDKNGEEICDANGETLDSYLIDPSYHHFGYSFNWQYYKTLGASITWKIDRIIDWNTNEICLTCFGEGKCLFILPMKMALKSICESLKNTTDKASKLNEEFSEKELQQAFEALEKFNFIASYKYDVIYVDEENHILARIENNKTQYEIMYLKIDPLIWDSIKEFFTRWI